MQNGYLPLKHRENIISVFNELHSVLVYLHINWDIGSLWAHILLLLSYAKVQVL